MALNYRALVNEEAHLVRQLHSIDGLLPNDLCNDDQQYPQLFGNQDSLFAPDAMFGGNQNVYQRVQDENNKEDKQIFEEYLDSLELSELVKKESYLGNKENKNGTKSFKNLENSLQCTFKPSILKKSNEMAGMMAPSFDRLTSRTKQTKHNKTPYQPHSKQLKKVYSKQRIQRLSKPRVLKTQTSEILDHKKQSVETKKIRNTYGMDIATRNKIWQEQKNEKIQKLREEEETIRLKKQQSTFVPKLTQYKGEKGVNISQFGKEGIANYFQRVNHAKMKIVKETSSTSFTREGYSNLRDSNNSPFGSTKTINNKTPPKEKNSTNNKYQRVKYQDAVKELHKKLMSLQI